MSRYFVHTNSLGDSWWLNPATDLKIGDIVRVSNVHHYVTVDFNYTASKVYFYHIEDQEVFSTAFVNFRILVEEEILPSPENVLPSSSSG